MRARNIKLVISSPKPSNSVNPIDKMQHLALEIRQSFREKEIVKTRSAFMLQWNPPQTNLRTSTLFIEIQNSSNQLRAEYIGLSSTPSMTTPKSQPSAEQPWKEKKKKKLTPTGKDLVQLKT